MSVSSRNEKIPKGQRLMAKEKKEGEHNRHFQSGALQSLLEVNLHWRKKKQLSLSGQAFTLCLF